MDKLKALFTKSDSKARHAKLRLGRGVEASWKIILLSTIILTVFVIALGVYMYIKIDKGEVFSSEKAPEEKAVLDINLLRKTISYYQNKAFEFENIDSKNVGVVDPSL